jgi:hypothetical protein
MCTNPANSKLIYIQQLVCAQCTFDGGDLIHYSIVLCCGLVQQAKKMKLQNKLFPPVGGGYEYEEWTVAG